MKLANLAERAGIDCPDAGETSVTGFAIDHRIHSQADTCRQFDPDMPAMRRHGRRAVADNRIRDFNLGKCRHRSRRDADQFSRHGLSSPCINGSAANLVLLTRRADRAAGPKCIPQNRQLLLHRPASSA